ncbi:MAG: TIGR02391 family protein [Terracidiphilus sp.]
MNLSSTINERLWHSVRATYEAGNYSGAILDSIYFLSDVIRDKSGLESDGVQLITSAFSGANPIIKINGMHTQSDQDEQQGMHLLLMGIYRAIRNPRSHEKRSDTPEVADSIILFVDYLLSLIDKARSPFDADQTIGKVFDPLFGQSEKYADLIVARVPVRKLLEILIQIFHRRTESPGKNVELFIKSALKTLSDEEQSSFWQVVSESLENATTDSVFRTIIQIAQNDWEKISEIARLRTEHRLIESTREGEFDQIKRTCTKGALGTWVIGLTDKMELKEDYAAAVITRLESASPAARAYVYEYHFQALRRIRQTPGPSVLICLKMLLRQHDRPTYNALSFVGEDVFADESDEKWIAALKDAYARFQPAGETYSSADDYAQQTEISDDDIPF